MRRAGWWVGGVGKERPRRRQKESVESKCSTRRQVNLAASTDSTNAGIGLDSPYVPRSIGPIDTVPLPEARSTVFSSRAYTYATRVARPRGRPCRRGRAERRARARATPRATDRTSPTRSYPARARSTLRVASSRTRARGNAEADARRARARFRSRPDLAGAK